MLQTKNVTRAKKRTMIVFSRNKRRPSRIAASVRGVEYRERDANNESSEVIDILLRVTF